MKYTRRDFKSKQKIHRKYTKNYQHNMNIITFLKSNYKYKRRCTKSNCSGMLRPNVPVLDEKNRITKKISLFKIKFSKILRIFILIMQQATPNTNNSNNNYSILLTQLVVLRTKQTRHHIKKNDVISYLASARDDDGISNNHRAYKDANEDTDTNTKVDIRNIDDEISHQQHNYDKVSTITSTPLRCQKQKHHQIKSTTSSSSLSPASSPSIITSDVEANYETCQWPATLRQYLHGHLLDPQHHHHHAMYKKSMPAGSLSSNCSDNSTGTSMSRAARTASICQSVDQYVSATWNSSYTLSGLLLTLFIAFTIGVRSTTAGACWQTVLDNGKCNEMFSLNISKSECCGANQEFAYTDREPTNVEYFFATAIGGGMECSPCLACGPNCDSALRDDSLIVNFFSPESCKNVQCAPNKKCVKRKGRPKCICAPECGAARRKRKQREHLMQQQHHTFLIDASDATGDRGRDAMESTSNAFKIKLEKSPQSRESRSLSSEMTNINLGLENVKDVANSRITSLMDRHHHREHNQPNQRKSIHTHMRKEQTTKQQQSDDLQPFTHQNQKPKETRRLLITANVGHTEKPTTRRLQIFSNVRTTHARRQNSNYNNNDDYHEDTDPSDYDEREEDYYGADDDDDDEEAIKGSTTANHNNRNDDATRLLNQSLSRHQLKTNTKPNSNKKKKKQNNHDLHRTKIQQHSNNNTSVRHPHHNGRHAENTLHHRHQHQHPQHNHQQQKQQHKHKHHHQQHRHGRQKHNKQQHKHQKNNTDSNTTMTTVVVPSPGTATASHSTLHNSFDIDAAAIATATAVSSTTIKTTVLNLSSPTSVTTTALPIISTTIPFTQTLPQLLSSSTTPVNSSMSAAYFTAAVSIAADSYHSQHLLNRGSEKATSSLLSSSAILSATAQSDSVFATTMSAKGEGVSLRRHQDHSEATTITNNTKNNSNNNRISTLNSYSGNNQHHLLLLQTQQGQQHDIPLFDGVVDQFAFHGSTNKQHTIKNVDNMRPTNPVCGTDGRTYNTECQLRKRACRTDNPNLQVSYRGHCKTTCNGVKCINGLTCVEDQYSMPHCIVCKIECAQDDFDNDVVDASRAVCGADGNTYKNNCDINRMICKIGRSIGIAYPGPCIEDQVTCDDINCGPKQVCLVDLLTHKPRCTTCRYKCSRKRQPSQLRSEDGKICGVNNRTYNSWCEMRKDSCSTGFHIAVKYSGNCH